MTWSQPRVGEVRDGGTTYDTVRRVRRDHWTEITCHWKDETIPSLPEHLQGPRTRRGFRMVTTTYALGFRRVIGWRS